MRLFECRFHSNFIHSVFFAHWWCKSKRLSAKKLWTGILTAIICCSLHSNACFVVENSTSFQCLHRKRLKCQQHLIIHPTISNIFSIYLSVCLSMYYKNIWLTRVFQFRCVALLTATSKAFFSVQFDWHFPWNEYSL